MTNVGQAVVGRVRDLLPVLRERAQETEDARDVPAESVKALTETGFFRLLQPATYGGHEADPVTFLTAVRLIASACGSTGWVASVLGVHPWQLALFPPRAQEEVWGADQATRMSSSYAPTGRAGEVDGGHRLTGRWSFSSGCGHATWVLLGAIVGEGDGRPPDFRTFLLPASDYVIDDVWDTVGLRHRQQRHRRRRRVCARAPLAQLRRRLPLRLPRPGRQPGAAVPAAIRVAVLVLDHHPDHRHGGRRLRRARGVPA